MGKRIISLFIMICLLWGVFPFLIVETFPTVIAAPLTSPELKELYSLRIKDALEEENNVTALASLNTIKAEIEAEVGLNELDLFKVTKEVNAAIATVIDKIKEEQLLYTAKTLQGLATSSYVNGVFYINLPPLKAGQSYVYKLSQAGAFVSSGITSGSIGLPELHAETTFDVNLEIMDAVYGSLLSATIKVAIKDEPLPAITSGFIEDGKVTLNFEGGYVLNTSFVVEEENGEKKELRIRGNTFRTTTPVVIDIPLTTPFGAKGIISLDIYADNVVFLGNVDKEIEERLIEKRTIALKKYDSIKNLFVGYSNKVINLEEESRELVSDKYGEEIGGTITFTSNDMTINGSMAELKKPGLNTVQINHSFYSREELTFYVYVIEDGFSFNTNIENISLLGKMTTSESTFVANDYLIVKQKIEGYSPILDFLFILDGDTVYKINKRLELEEGVLNSYKIIDVLTGKEYDLRLKYQPLKEEEHQISFKDVVGSHWAYHDIKELAFSGLAKGYEDGTFKPDSNMSVKEFMALLDRFSHKVQLSVNNFNHYTEVPLMETDWAYAEVLSVYRKVQSQNLNKINISNLDRQITRGEAAFLIDSVLKIEGANSANYLSDIYESIHREHIVNLMRAKVISGYPDGTFRPNGSITRAEVSSILNRLLNQSKGTVA